MMQLKEVLKTKGGLPVTVPATATIADAIRAWKAHNADKAP